MRRLLVSLLLSSLFGPFCTGRLLGQESEHPQAARCTDWSAKFDSIDDDEILRILRTHQKDGWESLLKQGEGLGISAATQIVDGERQLERSQMAAERDK